MIRAVLFDLDGTLVDSVPDLQHAAVAMMKQLNIEFSNPDKVRDWVGNGLDKLIHRLLTQDFNNEAEPELFYRGREIFFKAYDDTHHAFSSLYSGVEGCLSELKQRQFKLACVTNKRVQPARALLVNKGLDKWMDVLVGAGEANALKPDSAPLKLASERLQLPLKDCVMVGDSVNDIKAAQNAGILSVGVPYGYNHGRHIGESNPDFVVDSLSELPALIEKVLAKYSAA